MGRWKERFEELLKVENSKLEQETLVIYNEEIQDEEEIAFYEITDAMKKIKIGKTADFDEIKEVYKSVNKSSSGDESKENKPAVEPGVCMLDSTTLCNEQEISSDVHMPLTVNCDIASSTKLKSPLSSSASKRSKFSETLSPAIWPSFADLIEDTPQVEDPDAEDVTISDQKVVVDKHELEKVLTQAVSATRGCSILTLMDLYGQLNKVVNKFTRTHERSALPQDLHREITRFQELQNQLRSVSTSRCQTPAS